MEFILQSTELFKIIDRAAEYGTNRALEKCSKISAFMTRQECYKIAKNRRVVERALLDKSSGLITVLKGHREYITRESFDRWIMKNELLKSL